MCSCKRVIPLTQEGERLNRIIKILFVVKIIFIAWTIIFQRYDNWLSDILLLLLILFGFITCHFFIFGFLCFFVLFDIFFTLVFLCQRIQNRFQGLDDKFLTQMFHQAALLIVIAEMVFSCVWFYYAFQTYREYKAISMGSGQGGSYWALNNNNDEEGTHNTKGESKKGYTAFTGEGVKLGGS